MAATRQPYSYSYDNPLNMTDPAGLLATSEGGGCDRTCQALVFANERPQGILDLPGTAAWSASHPAEALDTVSTVSSGAEIGALVAPGAEEFAPAFSVVGSYTAGTSAVLTCGSEGATSRCKVSLASFGLQWATAGLSKCGFKLAGIEGGDRRAAEAVVGAYNMFSDYILKRHFSE